MRLIEGIPVDRARWRLTATYALTDALSVGVEYNPLDDDVGPLANWRLLDETDRRPALVVGTSSARIGTKSGRAYYATLSKDLERWTSLPVAPYAGVAWDGGDEEWKAIGGLNVRWSERWSSVHLWDGENLHHLLDYLFPQGHSLGVLAAEQDGTYYLGLRLGISLGGGSSEAGEAP